MIIMDGDMQNKIIQCEKLNKQIKNNTTMNILTCLIVDILLCIIFAILFFNFNEAFQVIFKPGTLFGAFGILGGIASVANSGDIVIGIIISLAVIALGYILWTLVLISIPNIIITIIFKVVKHNKKNTLRNLHNQILIERNNNYERQ